MSTIRFHCLVFVAFPLGGSKGRESMYSIDALAEIPKIKHNKTRMNEPFVLPLGHLYLLLWLCSQKGFATSILTLSKCCVDFPC